MAQRRLALAGLCSQEEFQSLLIRELGLPDYYGGNLDAFDECLEDYCATDQVVITGLAKLAPPLRAYVDRYLAVMKHLQKSSDDLFSLAIE